MFVWQNQVSKWPEWNCTQSSIMVIHDSQQKSVWSVVYCLLRSKLQVKFMELAFNVSAVNIWHNICTVVIYAIITICFKLEGFIPPKWVSKFQRRWKNRMKDPQMGGGIAYGKGIVILWSWILEGFETHQKYYDHYKHCLDVCLKQPVLPNDLKDPLQCHYLITPNQQQLQDPGILIQFWSWKCSTFNQPEVWWTLLLGKSAVSTSITK